MKRRDLVIAFSAIILVVAITGKSMGTVQPDIHRARFACTTCHITTPPEGATRENAPLIMSPPELCLACHGDTHGE